MCDVTLGTPPRIPAAEFGHPSPPPHPILGGSAWPDSLPRGVCVHMRVQGHLCCTRMAGGATGAHTRVQGVLQGCTCVCVFPGAAEVRLPAHACELEVCACLRTRVCSCHLLRHELKGCTYVSETVCLCTHVGGRGVHTHVHTTMHMHTCERMMCSHMWAHVRLFVHLCTKRVCSWGCTRMWMCVSAVPRHACKSRYPCVHHHVYVGASPPLRTAHTRVCLPLPCAHPREPHRTRVCTAPAAGGARGLLTGPHVCVWGCA